MRIGMAVGLWAGISCGLTLTDSFCNPASAAVEPASKDFSIVKTDSGSLKGGIYKGYRRFVGIPYAAPPVGDLRFVAPQPVKSWHGVRKATHLGYSCPQAADPSLFLFGSTHEDCLYLNVYTPYPLSGKPLPVMIWIHGGGFVTGTGADYLPSNFSIKGNVIIVTINYRLGPFGFLAHPALTAESEGASGNYGLLDQQAAIGWVQHNARAFGGDSHNITIFGESAGGASVCSHLASPAMAGQFQRAIIESGPCTAPMTQSLQAAETVGQSIASQNGCPTTADPAAADCLRQLPVSALLAAEGSVSLTSSVPFMPAYGGSILPLNPGVAIATGQYNRVPVIQGTNHDEGRIVSALSFDLAGGPLSSDQYPSVIQGAYASNGPAVLAQYPLSAFDSPDLAFAAAVTDSFFSCPALSTDQSLIQQNNVIYAYEFADETAPSFLPSDGVSFPMGAFHGAEVGYLFSNPLQHLNWTQKTLSDQMIGYWSHFAKTGNPNYFGAPNWPQFDPSLNNFLSLVPEATRVTTGFVSFHQCAFWTGLPQQQ